MKKLMILLLTFALTATAYSQEESDPTGAQKASEVNKGQKGEQMREQNREKREAKQAEMKAKQEAKKAEQEAKKAEREAKKAEREAKKQSKKNRPE